MVREIRGLLSRGVTFCELHTAISCRALSRDVEHGGGAYMAFVQADGDAALLLDGHRINLVVVLRIEVTEESEIESVRTIGGK